MKILIKSTVLSAAVVCATAFTCQQASAATVLSMNFVDGSTSAYNGAGVLDTDARLWDTMFDGRVNSNGGYSTSGTFGDITVNVADFGDFSSHTAPTLSLFDGYVFSGNTNNGAEFITLSGLDTSKTYELAVYAAFGWGSFDNSFSITDLNGTTDNATTTGANISSFEDGVNYVTFAGLKAKGDGTITLNLAGGATDTTKWMVSGLEMTAIPEPSAYAALAGFLALGWVMLRRRA